MPAGKNVFVRPISERIEELKAKISLLDGDRKAYIETSQYALERNKEIILKFRKENRELHLRLNDLKSQDEHVINTAFKDKPIEKYSLKNKSGKDAITVMDYKVCDVIKRLNSFKHQKVLKQKKLEELKLQTQQMIKDASDASDALAKDKGESEEAQRIRYLENRCDKAQLKIHEATHLKRTYQQILNKLKEDSLSWPATLEGLEKELRQCQTELKELQGMHSDAQISKDSTQTALRKQEEVVYSEKRKREIDLHKMKKEAEEKKMLHERIERRFNTRNSFGQDDVSSIEKQVLSGEEQQQKITTYEEAFKRIKDATGVSDTMEVVFRFQNQGETTRHLEEIKLENEKKIVKLQEEKEQLHKEYQVMKYTGDAKISSGQKLVEGFEVELKKEEKCREEADERLLKLNTLLLQAKAGIEHLADKLHQLKGSGSETRIIRPTSDEYVLYLLDICEDKLLTFLESLAPINLDEMKNKMIQEEFSITVDTKLPPFNTRVKLPHLQKETKFDDDSDGEDDLDAPSRSSIKKQSQNIIDLKTKRRVPRRKKKPK